MAHGCPFAAANNAASGAASRGGSCGGAARCPLALLVAAAICAAFTGLQEVVPAAWLQHLLVLRFFSRARVGDRPWSHVVALTVAAVATQACGMTVAYAGMYAIGPNAHTLSSWLLVAVNVLPMTAVLLLPCLADSLFRYTYRLSAHLHPLVFPLVSASIWTLLSLLSPFGATAHPLYSLRSLLPLVQATAWVGMDGVLLVAAWLVGGVHQVMWRSRDCGSSGWGHVRASAALLVGLMAAGSARETVLSSRFFQQPLSAAMAPSVPVSCLLSQAPTTGIPPQPPASLSPFAAGASMPLPSLSLPTASAEAAGARQLLQGGEGEDGGDVGKGGEGQQGGKGVAQGGASAVAGSAGVAARAEGAEVAEAAETASAGEAAARETWEEWEAWRLAGIASMLQQTQQRATAGDTLVLWSEASVILWHDHEEQKLLADLAAIATAASANRTASAAPSAGAAGPSSLGPYLGASYMKRISPGRFTNSFALIAPAGGAPILRYNKSHPVPSVEDNVLPGRGTLPVVDTPLGRISVAICFDLQFPALISQAGSQGVDILLQPSWTWGAIGHMTFETDAVRAAENGLTLLRCSSIGVSGVVTPYYRTLAAREGLATGLLTMHLPLLPRAPALYPYISLPMSLLLLSLTLLAAFLAIAPPSLSLPLCRCLPAALCSLLPHPLCLAGQQRECEREKRQG
ncbi:hypothetical protein CLOP_g25302 [Closterium sp. NIES-67]|nr:hypothetical protein CLOP_g25302 [Closterium sp. NIES-67]